MKTPLRRLVRLFALCLAASVAAAQQGEGIVTIGTSPSGPSPITGHRNVPPGTSAHAELNAVLSQDFGGGGGSIVLLPGVYELDEPVTITAPGVSVRGSRAAILRPRFPNNAGLVGLFDVRARDGQGLALVDNRFEGFGLFLDVQSPFSAVELEEMDAVLIGANTGLWTSPYWTITAGGHQVSAEDFAD